MRLSLAIFALGLALAVARSAPPQERRYVWPCALAVAANWLWYASSFLPAPFTPSWLIYGLTGSVIDPKGLWTVGDVVTAMWIISVANNRFWGWSLHSLYLSQIVMEIAAPSWIAHLDDGLTVLFYLQIACLLVGGSDGIMDFIGHWSPVVPDQTARRGFSWRRGYLHSNRRQRMVGEETDPLEGIHKALSHLHRID